MELRHLRYFIVVAEEQNVTRAAERLHVSQPPLSRQIRDLEQELGVSLFRRTAKSLALTEAGKIFLNEARGVLLQAEKAVQAVRAVAAGDRGQLRVGYAPSLTVEILPKALREFENAGPGVRVTLHDLSTEECVQKINARKIDVALTVRPSGSSMRGLTFDKITSYPICCAVATTHPLAKKRSISLAQFRKERLMGYSQEDYPEYFDWLADIFKPEPFDPCGVEQYDSATGLIAAVEAGRGVALVSTSMKCLTGPRVKLLPISPALSPIVVGALTGKSASVMAQRFIAAVKKVA
jgi:LysR family transcriptional regulator, benzoate and cis,cis-muconate-responsive activator of ben and cat genes